ncbi:hypothetical protein MHA_0325 [Mannheimia haemolytica PHL213]|nr:hypothetical protein MHA_0325 [Mannheimia haemolytica PHL213]
MALFFHNFVNFFVFSTACKSGLPFYYKAKRLLMAKH